MLRRLAWLALIPTLAAASGAHGAPAPAELAFTIGFGDEQVPCVTGTGGITGARRLGSMGIEAGAWSPDGERFALSNRRAILVENADGSGLHAVTAPRTPYESDEWPAWSPDGSEIAFSRYVGTSRSGIWIVDLATGAERQISGDYADSLSWSPTGDLIAADFGYMNSSRSAALLKPDGTVVQALSVPFDRTWAAGVAWSPDGTRIALGGGVILDRSGVIVGRYALQPTHETLVAARPAWSPDGSTIAYEGFRTAFDGGTESRYQLQSDLYEVPVAGGPAVALTRTPDLFERAPSFRPGTHATAAGTSQHCVILGTSKADVILGTPKDDVILAGSGNDVVRGGGGQDIVYGGPGNDVLYGGAGYDWLLGGTGDDRLHVQDGGPDLVYGGPQGHDVAWIDNYRIDTATGVERIETRR